jgi:hypothetical protein
MVAQTRLNVALYVYCLSCFFCGLFYDAVVTPNYVVCTESNGGMTDK